MFALRQRNREPELMDDPQLDGAQHEVALRALARLNTLSGSVRVIWKPILRLVQQKQLRQLRVLDVATGSGDIPLGLYQRAQRCGLRLEILGVDISQLAVETARERAAKKRFEIAFEVLDVLNNDLPADFDVVISSLFLHHLEEQHAIRLLDQMRRASRQLGLVNDLVRNGANLLLVHLAARLCTRSHIVHVDGPRSIKAAFTPHELSSLAAAAGIENAQVTRHWPCRMLLQWQAVQEKSRIL